MIQFTFRSSPVGKGLTLGATQDYASARLGAIVKRLNLGWAEPLRIIGYEFLTLERDWLNSEGKGSWVPLNPKYAKRKMKYVGAKPILQYSGMMYKALTSTSGRNLTIRNNFLRINTEGARYWAVHQHGSVKKRIPKRQVITPDLRAQFKKWSRMLADWYAGKPLGPNGVNRSRTR